MYLSPDQQKALNVYASGKSLLIIGPAGCGKSFVINRIENYPDSKKVYVTAMSGIQLVVSNRKAQIINTKI